MSAMLLGMVLGLYAEEYPDFHQTIGTLPNEGSVSVPQNTYRLDLAGKGTFRITNKKNLLIDGNGSTLICNKQINAFNFSGCENVTFSNFFIDYDPPCSTQGTITGITNNAKTLEVEIHEGYPMPNPALTFSSILIYDGETRELVRNFHTTYAEGSIQVDNAARKVILNIGGAKTGAYKVGDFIDFTNVVDGGGHAVVSQNSKNMTFSGITLYDSPSMAFVEGGCENSYYYRCEINRKTNQPGRPQDRLRSARADGFHCKTDATGPTIEECTVKYQGDDVVNISGYFYPVYKVNQSRKRVYVLTTTSDYTGINLKNNDSLTCVGNDGLIRGKNRITDVTGASTAPAQEELDACFAKLTSIREKDNLIYGASIALDEWIEGLDAGDMIYASNRVGNGFRLLNNNVGHNRSRSFLIKASNGKIQGNRISGSAMSAIAIGPEFYWLEAGCPQNLEISGNIISDCMFDESMVSSVQAGAITVACEAPNGLLAKAGAFDNISIHHNTITNCPKPCVFLNSIVSGYFYENTLEPDESMVRYHGYNFSVDNRSAYFEKNVGNIIKEAPQTNAINSNRNDNIVRIDSGGYISFPLYGAAYKTSLTVYDMTGRIVLTDRFYGTSSVSLKALPKGAYIAKLVCNDKLYVRKLL
jgi:hypothetical protein